MRTRRAEARYAAVFAVLAAAATAAILATRGESAAPPFVASASPQSWRAILGAPAQVDLGSRVIVVLKTPSLGERVAAGGGLDFAQEQAWTSVELSAQKLLLARMALQGVVVRADIRFTRVLDGFSALVPQNVVPLLERDANVAGVYPVRAAYPTTVSTGALNADAVEIGGPLASAGIDGRGVTVAVIDTGVDPTVPLVRGRVLPQIDVAGPGGDEHGTQMAAVVARVAPGATILPIRVAAAYARSDQLIEGLDRAADPNGDGDAHDAVQIALVALAEPFAGFPDGPEALAAAGARALDVLVVAPSGNDGPAGAAYGDLSAPGGAAAALTVGALDTRAHIAEARVVIRSGLHTVFDATTALASDAAPTQPLVLQVTAPRRGLFTERGGSVVAGRAALLPATASPQAAGDAGASAVLLYGRTLITAGALGSAVHVPVVSLPQRVARIVRARLAAGERVSVIVGAGQEAPNPGSGQVAPFSSMGLAFDGSVKPDVVAPGVAFPASGGLTVDGSSVAAAVTAGTAALLAQARPSLDADALAGLLIGTAREVPHDPVTAQGAGEVDVGAAAAGELAASPPTLALGMSTFAGRKIRTGFTLTNLSSRTVRATLSIHTQHEGAAAVDFAVRPRRIAVAPGHSVVVRVDALTASPAIGSGSADGAVVAEVAGGGSVRVPWVLAFAPRPLDPIVSASLAPRSLRLTVDVGRVTTVAGLRQIQPLERLDIGLSTPAGRPLGLLARIRDVLPGRYTFQLTGRSPSGAALPPGQYVAAVVAYPADGGLPGRRNLAFTVR
ncbi:MAG TPA: S8 family serine peptidase [Gaiellaceae bacterium]